MKLNYLLLVGATSFLTSVLPVASHAGEMSVNQSSKAVVAQNQTVAIMSGNFMAAEKPTSGMARIVTENGHRYLELNEAFSTSDQGPDLHVILEPAAKPAQSYANQNMGKFVNLGKLQKFKGTQRYPIPDSINLENFKSVNIWCRMANATFGYAPLRSTSTANAK